MPDTRSQRKDIVLGGMTVSTVDAWGDSDAWGNSDSWGIAGGYYNVKNCHHFIKSQPVETHLLTQRFSNHSAGALSGIYDSTAAVPTSASDRKSTRLNSSHIT